MVDWSTSNNLVHHLSLQDFWGRWSKGGYTLEGNCYKCGQGLTSAQVVTSVSRVCVFVCGNVVGVGFLKHLPKKLSSALLPSSFQITEPQKQRFLYFFVPIWIFVPKSRILRAHEPDWFVCQSLLFRPIANTFLRAPLSPRRAGVEPWGRAHHHSEVCCRSG